MSRAPRPKEGPQYPVNSVDNVLRLLRLYVEATDLGVVEASRQLGVAPSTVHRLFSMLVHHDFVAQDQGTRRYYPSAGLIELGMAIILAHDERAIIRPALTLLAAELRETASFAVLRADEVVFVESVEPQRTVRATARSGSAYPAHCTAAGRALLAEMDTRSVESLYPTTILTGGTGGAPKTLTELKGRLSEVAEAGYATQYGESEEDIGAVALVVRDRSGKPRGALSLTMPVERLRMADVATLVEGIRRCANNLSPQLV